jgi:Uma2 family endonuclease
MTLEDFENLPESLDRCEILQGELIVTPAPRPDHQDLLQQLSLAFMTAVRAKRFGKVYVTPIGVRLTTNDIVQPDYLFYREQSDHWSAPMSSMARRM